MSDNEENVEIVYVSDSQEEEEEENIQPEEIQEDEEEEQEEIKEEIKPKKKPKKKRPPMTPERKAKLIEQLKAGRIKALENRRKKALIKKMEKEKKEEELENKLIEGIKKKRGTDKKEELENLKKKYDSLVNEYESEKRMWNEEREKLRVSTKSENTEHRGSDDKPLQQSTNHNKQSTKSYMEQPKKRSLNISDWNNMF